MTFKVPPFVPAVRILTAPKTAGEGGGEKGL